MQENYIKTHIFTIPELIRTYGNKTRVEIRKSIPEDILKNVEHIIISGCGYSHAVGMNAKYFFESIAEVSTENLFSVDASRHKSLNVLQGENRTLVIGISNSGIVARVEELLHRYAEFGVLTIAFTENADSKCGRAAEYIVSTKTPALPSSLPLRSYVLSLLNCYALAWEIRRAKGNAESCETEFYQKLLRIADELERSLVQISVEVRAFAEMAADAQAYEFVGSGIEYAQAWLGKQLIVGQTGKIGIDCSLEDWLHSDFFMSNPKKMATILYFPGKSEAKSRILEVKGYMEYLERNLCVITDDAEIAKTCQHSILLPKCENRLMEALTEFIPTALLAGEVCELIGETYSRGFRDKWDFSKGGKATEFSEIKILK